MNPRPLKVKTGPEAIIQSDFVDYLRIRQWVVKETHGNLYQSGLPDLYIAHKDYGARWVECKNPLAYSFTPAQLEFFPLLASAGIGIWIIIASTDEEYAKLWAPANWWSYLPLNKPRVRKRENKTSTGYVPKYPFKIPNGFK